MTLGPFIMLDETPKPDPDRWPRRFFAACWPALAVAVVPMVMDGRWLEALCGLVAASCARVLFLEYGGRGLRLW